MATVKQLITKIFPPGTEIIAGESGLFNEVSWIISLRPVPPGISGLSGNDFVLVSIDVLEVLDMTFPYLISSLAERGASGAAVQGKLKPSDIEEARSKNFTVLQLPDDINLITLENEAAHYITEERKYIYQKEREFSQAFMALALDGANPSEIIKRINELTSREAGIVDSKLEPYYFISQDTAEKARSAVKQSIPKFHLLALKVNAPVIGIRLSEDEAAFIGVIKVGSETRGYLMIAAPEEELDETIRLAVRLGSLALAVEYSRRQAIQETEDRFEVDIIGNLLTGDLSAREFEDIARRLEMDLSFPYIGLTLRFTGLRTRQSAILRTLTGLFPKANFYTSGDDLSVLLPLDSELKIIELRKWSKRMFEVISSHFEEKFTLGIGRTYFGTEGIRRTFRESNQALAMGIRLFGKNSVTNFADLGVYRLLFSLKSKGELDAFFEEYLGKLAEYDEKHNGELIQTLKAYLYHGSVADTARVIHIHRNTLLYRLTRIREITGYELEDGETRLTLHLAVLAGEILNVN